MGACTFFHDARGSTAQKAFTDAVADAQYEYGHRGYTGTIAEKNKFTLIPLPAGKEARAYANELIDACDPRIDDKWGPAGCIHVGNDKWLFFGWASE